MLFNAIRCLPKQMGPAAPDIIAAAGMAVYGPWPTQTGRCAAMSHMHSRMQAYACTAHSTCICAVIAHMRLVPHPQNAGSRLYASICMKLHSFFHVCFQLPYAHAPGPRTPNARPAIWSKVHAGTTSMPPARDTTDLIPRELLCTC